MLFVEKMLERGKKLAHVVIGKQRPLTSKLALGTV